MRLNSHILRHLGLVLLDVISIVVLSFFLASAFCWAFSPAKHPFISTFAMAFPILLLAEIAMVICWLFCRKWIMACVMALPMLIAYDSIAYVIPITLLEPHITSEDTTFTIMTYNCHSLSPYDKTLNDNNKNSDRNITLDAILNSGADIVCLQECFDYNLTSFSHVGTQQLKDLNRIYPYNRRSGYDNAVFSKYPIVEYTCFAKDSEIYSITRSAIKINNDTVVLFNTHLQSFALLECDKNAFKSITSPQNITQDIENRNLIYSFFRRHLFPKLSLAMKERQKQAQKLATLIKQEVKSVIVCGDFNDVPNSYAHRIIGKGLHDVHREVGNGIQYTFYASHFFFRIDHIFYTPGRLNAIDLKIKDWKYSDHYPQVVTFSLPKE